MGSITLPKLFVDCIEVRSLIFEVDEKVFSVPSMAFLPFWGARGRYRAAGDQRRGAGRRRHRIASHKKEDRYGWRHTTSGGRCSTGNSDETGPFTLTGPEK
jgi:hypothetical protein